MLAMASMSLLPNKTFLINHGKPRYAKSVRHKMPSLTWLFAVVPAFILGLIALVSPLALGALIVRDLYFTQRNPSRRMLLALTVSIIASVFVIIFLVVTKRH